jgi:ABC-type Fe3+-siderophore transport system permease subunit
MNQREWHQAREQALQRMERAALAAYIGGSLGLLIFITIGLSDGDWRVVWSAVLGSALTVLLGWLVHWKRSQLASAILLINAAATLLLRVLLTGSFIPLVGFLFVYLYFEGMRGAVDYAELAKEPR